MVDRSQWRAAKETFERSGDKVRIKKIMTSSKNYSKMTAWKTIECAQPFLISTFVQQRIEAHNQETADLVGREVIVKDIFHQCVFAGFVQSISIQYQYYKKPFLSCD